MVQVSSIIDLEGSFGGVSSLMSTLLYDEASLFECGMIGQYFRTRAFYRVNKKVAEWRNEASEACKGLKLSDLLSIGGKIYFETHLWQLLRMQGFFDEVVVELADTGSGKLPVFINGYERRGSDGRPLCMRFMLFRAADRRLYEQNLQETKSIAERKLEEEKENALLREQFIAVLGHDLRNPLSAIDGVAQIMSRSSKGKAEEQFARVLTNGVKRMSEMIDNVLGFARRRLGEGIILNLQPVNLAAMLADAVAEMR